MAVWRRLSRLANRARPGCVVLAYHRVSDDTADVWRNAVSCADFAGHVRLLRERYRILPLDALVDTLAAGHSLPPRTVVITFDDGYAVNVENACTILADERVPATFYVNTAWLEGEPFWWDEIANLVEAPPRARAMWDRLVATGCASGEFTKLSLLQRLRAMCRTMALPQRSAWLAELRATDAPVQLVRPDLMPMRRAQIAALSHERWFTVGGHTHAHPALGQVSGEHQRSEIQENKRILEAITGRPITHFSYPFGGRDDFDETTVDELRAAGYRSATTMLGGPARRGCDLFRIPRLSVKNWDAGRLERHITDLWGND